jgi:hypothetical protein
MHKKWIAIETWFSSQLLIKLDQAGLANCDLSVDLSADSSRAIG